MPVNQSHEFFIQLHLTERCNLRCTHCYQTGAHSDEMSLAEISDLAEETAEALQVWSDEYGVEFARSFNVTGGEPFLRTDLFPILEEIRSRGFDLYLLTNGILIDGERARLLHELGVKGVQVSIEGPEEVHDGIRGLGSFRASLEGVRHLCEAGLEVTLNVTLSKLNAGCLSDLISLAGSCGAQNVGFSRLVPSGRGQELLDKMLASDHVRELYQSLSSRECGPVKLVSGDPVLSQLRAGGSTECGSVARSGCAAGISGLTILPDGTITPCRRLPLPIGNVRTDSIREVWANSDTLASLRDRARYRGRCGRCPRWADCRGCRAIAYAHAVSKGIPDICADDPQCFLA